jgi:hypothetical protein
MQLHARTWPGGSSGPQNPETEARSHRPQPPCKGNDLAPSTPRASERASYQPEAMPTARGRGKFREGGKCTSPGVGRPGPIDPSDPGHAGHTPMLAPALFSSGLREASRTPCLPTIESPLAPGGDIPALLITSPPLHTLAPPVPVSRVPSPCPSPVLHPPRPLSHVRCPVPSAHRAPGTAVIAASSTDTPRMGKKRHARDEASGHIDAPMPTPTIRRRENVNRPLHCTRAPPFVNFSCAGTSGVVIDVCD